MPHAVDRQESPVPGPSGSWAPVPGAPTSLLPADAQCISTAHAPADWLQSGPLVPGARAADFVDKDAPTSSDEPRPLMAGVPIIAEGLTGHGTLGFFVRTGNRSFAVTAWHVIATNKLLIDIFGIRNVSQPDTSCLGCSKNYIGKVAAGERSHTVDIALIELSPDMHYVADVRGLGGKDARGKDIDLPIRGVHALTSAEVLGTPPVQVKKRGFVTGLTGGKIVPGPNTPGGPITDGKVTSEVNVIFGNQLKGCLQVSANPNPAFAGAGTLFSTRGDSGSAVLLDTAPGDPNFNQLVGMMVAGNPAPKTNDLDAPRDPFTIFIPIETILDYLHNSPNVAAELNLSAAQQAALNVVTATAPGQVQFAAGSAPATARAAVPARAAENPAPADATQRLRASRTGRRYLDLFERHRSELTRLINRHRPVAVAWHRSGAAELAQGLRRAVLEPPARVPEQVAGRPIRESIDAFVAALQRHGSATLVADLREARDMLPEMAGRTFSEILDQFVLADAGPADAALRRKEAT